MLYDARRALPQVKRDILDAADYIREHGWCQYRRQTDDGRVCIAGALFVVSGDRSPALAHYLTGILNDRPTRWNDEPSRTKEQVIAKLEEIGWSA